jgi:hypothetical protein
MAPNRETSSTLLVSQSKSGEVTEDHREKKNNHIHSHMKNSL